MSPYPSIFEVVIEYFLHFFFPFLHDFICFVLFIGLYMGVIYTTYVYEFVSYFDCVYVAVVLVSLVA